MAAAAREFFAPSAFTGVIVGDADVVGPGLRALGAGRPAVRAASALGTRCGPSPDRPSTSGERVRPGRVAAGHFALLGPPVLSRSAVVRDEPLRYDTARQCAGWRTARLLVVDVDGRAPVEWTGRVPRCRGGWAPTARRAWSPSRTTGRRRRADAVLLGEADGTAYWAVREPERARPGEDPVSRGRTCARQAPRWTPSAPACSPPPSPC